MSLNKNYLAFYFQLFLTLSVCAQKKVADTTTVETLNEVVVTGQYNPQSIKQSIYNVTVIKREQIELQAANNLADLLNFNLNLTVIPNAQTGRSTISFFGLDAQYFNILIDNIPLVSDTGIGNNIDLTQINLDTVERIEIVEGAMGVEFGANAVSGVINIITKTSSTSNWDIKTTIQEETVGNEYAWFNEGRHIQAIAVGHNITPKLYVNTGLNRNDFTGFLNAKQGRDHIENDGQRGYEWLPKKQITTFASINYTTETFRLNYKFDYFNERINFYDQTVRPNINIQAQTSNPSATDRVFYTNRFVNSLHANGHFKSGLTYKAALSYQTQKRDINEFNYFILSKQKSNERNETYQSSEVIFSKGSLTNFTSNKHLNFELGYETRFNKVYDTQASGSFTQRDQTQTQENYALFASTEYTFNKAFSIRPGLRFEYNSTFNSKITGSFSARYLINNGYELRANIGSAYRTPNFEELYFYFVDSNHDVRGNENLDPEKGFTAALSLKKRSWFNSILLSNTLKLSYLDLDKKIDLAVVNTSPLSFQYINIDRYKLWSITNENSLKANHFTFTLGATLQGISRTLENEENSNSDFLYILQANTAATYFIKPWQTSLSLLLKYQGKQDQFVANGNDSNGATIYTKQTTDSYTWLDASIKKSFLKNALTTTLGARNLLDVTQVDISTTGAGSGTHALNTNSLLLGYGRSYYIKLTYNLNF